MRIGDGRRRSHDPLAPDSALQPTPDGGSTSRCPQVSAEIPTDTSREARSVTPSKSVGKPTRPHPPPSTISSVYGYQRLRACETRQEQCWKALIVMGTGHQQIDLVFRGGGIKGIAL